jgi:transposase
MRGKILKNADELLESLRNFEDKDLFVKESTGFHEPIYDTIESKDFKVKVAKPLKVKLIAYSRIKNDKIDGYGIKDK